MCEAARERWTGHIARRGHSSRAERYNCQMLDRHLLVLFLAAATLLAVTPGPGIFYVLARTLSGGKREGVLSALGTFIGGTVHVLAAGFGLSAVLAASATAFAVVKYAGALYLVWLGFRMIRTRNVPIDEPSETGKTNHTFRQGVVTEVLNPKTALFFLSFLPQFVNLALGHIVVQFLLLGIMSVSMNTTADLFVVSFAAPIGTRLRSSARFRRNQRVASGVGMIGLGAFVAFGEK
jgi:threonine/homoserine/homoserine lactone efflux protein